MALLKLNDIGKIYVSEGNVAVGIRGVNLKLDRGEFVAVTGQSGSGKSTLLNVISGMDTYEEGEMYIEGMPTSHYLQADWEEYRKQYISFIFQDYNIIDSFTVLQNVELALMHITDKSVRRARALELIDRVGLTSHIRQKGSKLSGGQKQRTVIARALAKDSPIILADEPTGNLDSATSAEIIKLLREVSKDKLLIVVTHNFEQVEEYATRHIRVFDGAIESDHVISRPNVSEEKNESSVSEAPRRKSSDIRNGLTLGRSIFTGRPKLSVFLCLLLIVGTLGIFFVTSLCGEAGRLFEDTYMFTPIDGRVVVTRQDGAVMSDADVAVLAEKYGATDYLHYDALLDTNNEFVCMLDGMQRGDFLPIKCVYGTDVGTPDAGRYPEADDEVLLYLPISAKPFLQDKGDELGKVNIGAMSLRISGVKYYADNNLTARCVFTREGFEVANGVMYFISNGHTNIEANVTLPWGEVGQVYFNTFISSFDVEKGKIYIDSEKFSTYIGKDGVDTKTEIRFMATCYQYSYDYSTDASQKNFSHTFTEADISKTGPANMTSPSRWGGYEYADVAISPYALHDMAEEVLEHSYKQASLFFENDRAAEQAILKMREDGYIAVSSHETYTPDAMTAFENILIGVLYALVWILAVLFLAFFIHLCSSRTIGSFRSDVAIMRSMGIAVKSIRVGMYVRMIMALIPAYIAVIVAGVLISTVPIVNSFFSYLYLWQYALIFIGMLLLSIRVTQKQIKKLFGQSVKKALRGGAAND